MLKGRGGMVYRNNSLNINIVKKIYSEQYIGAVNKTYDESRVKFWPDQNILTKNKKSNRYCNKIFYTSYVFSLDYLENCKKNQKMTFQCDFLLQHIILL